MKRVYVAAELRHPVGHWFRVCGGRVAIFRDGARICFTHIHERRA
ncbi:hypothetical protein [Mycobacterium tuberculosis]|nr:hypothetical protein [Mycobacterium tuberculosis]